MHMPPSQMPAACSFQTDELTESVICPCTPCLQVVAVPSSMPDSAAAAPEGAYGTGRVPGAALGHLPAPVARHLAPLLDSGRVVVESVAPAPPGGSGGADAVVIRLALRPRAHWRRWRRESHHSGSVSSAGDPPAEVGGDHRWDEGQAAASAGAGASPTRQCISGGGSSGACECDGNAGGPEACRAAGHVHSPAPASSQQATEADGVSGRVWGDTHEMGSSESDEPLSTQAVAAAVADAVAAEGAARARGAGHVLVDSFRTMAARVRCGSLARGSCAARQLWLLRPGMGGLPAVTAQPHFALHQVRCLRKCNVLH